MKLTNRQLSLIKWAIDIAIESERELIRAHQTGWRNGKRIVPGEHRLTVAKAKRCIAALVKVRGVIHKGEKEHSCTAA